MEQQPWRERWEEHLAKQRAGIRARAAEQERKERERIEEHARWREQRIREMRQTIEELRFELHSAVERRNIADARTAYWQLSAEKSELDLLERFG